MCYQCTEKFVNIETLPVFEELGVDPGRDAGYELTQTGVRTVDASRFEPANRHSHDAMGTHTHAAGGAPHTHPGATSAGTGTGGGTSGGRGTGRGTPVGRGTGRGTPVGRGTGREPSGGRGTGDHRRGPLRDRDFQVYTDGDGAYVPHQPDPLDVEASFQVVDIEGYDDLLEAARNVLDKERAIYTTSHGQVREAGARPGAGYDMDEGTYDQALMVVAPNYDHRVYQAFADAIREKGTRVDTVVIESTMGEIDPWEDELPGVQEGLVKGHPLIRTTGVRWWEDFAEESDDYDLLIYGVGGPPRQLDDTDYERIPWRNEADLVSAGTFFPTPVWNLINEKTADIVREADRVRMTDPEGTDLTFTNYNHQHTTRGYPGHIFGHPSYLLPEIDTSGVVAGTLNHAGAYPRIEVELEGAKVVDVHGGGRYGQLWREMLDETEHIQYPGMPGEGLFWMFELAIGTNPKVSRPVVEDITRIQFPEMDRRRSGVVHCGFGCYYDIEPWAAKIKDVPWGHVHVHLNFPTYTAEMPDGEEITLIEDGHLTVLDDPEVRAKASEFGDPDQLLTEDWVPAVPGISVEGDYNDYASDPIDWIQGQMADRVAD